ncbi:hypothetical protein [Spirosoma agri]|nr:hypothetical protein [Spirosoma agri]
MAKVQQVVGYTTLIHAQINNLFRRKHTRQVAVLRDMNGNAR